MFDISVGEIIVVGGAAMLLLGKKEMPLVFRLVGRAVGKVSGLIQGGRARMMEMSQGSELMQLQTEIRSNLDDLRVIRAELRGAARLPAGVTTTSHPGTQVLREEARSAADPLGSASQRHLTSSPAPSFGEHLSSTVDTAGAVDTAAFGAVSTSTAPPMSTGASFAAEGRLSPVGTSWTAGESRGAGGKTVGVPAGLPASPIMSVSSAGGDRLQQLAMAEVGFSHQGLYVPKTDSAPGGADIINDAIIDSLMQERFQKLISSSKGSADGDAQGSSTTAT